MRRTLVRTLIALPVLAVLVGLGLFLGARLLSPERLEAIAEAQLSRITGHPVSIGRLEVDFGVGIQLRGEDVEFWPLADGPALRVESAGLGLDPLSLLVGNLRPRRIRLEGAELRIVEHADGGFSAPFEEMGRSEAPPSPHPSELLAPLIAIENFFRLLLERPHIADSVEASRSRVILVREARPGAALRVFSLAIAEGELTHHRLLGDSVLELRGGLFDRSGPLGDVELRGRRDIAGELDLGLRLSGLELSALEKYLPGLKPGSGLGGHAGGSLAFRSSSPGRGRLEVELVLDEPEARVLEETPWGPVHAVRIDLGGRLVIEPDRVELEDARLTGAPLHVELAGRIARPLGPGSRADLSLTFRDMQIAQLRALLHWLPTERARALETGIEPVVSGELRSLTARGAGPVSEWQALFRGEPAGTSMVAGDAELVDLVLDVGDGDRIDGLGGRASWTGDRLEISGAKGWLNGEPLPELDLGFEGLSRLAASAPERRVLRGGALALPGIEALAELLSGRDDGESAPVEIDLELDWLHHPILIWPLEGARARMRTGGGALAVEIAEATWAGMPVAGGFEWTFGTEPRVRVDLRAVQGEPGPPAPAEAHSWGRGRFRVGAIRGRHWRQGRAAGSFRARAGILGSDDLEVALEPAGRVVGMAEVDLSRSGAVPFQASLALSGGDLDALIRQIGADEQVATGSVDAWATLEGSLQPGVPAFSDFSGLLEVSARDGVIHRSLPPIVALAMASRSFNPFVERESIRYHEARSLAEFADGRISSRELTVDGPDMRVVASGGIDLVDEAHRIDAEVALFLFRPIDKAVGTIPLLNVMLLGPDQNLMAAYFELNGPWKDPKPQLVPLKSIAAGPGSLVTEGVPGVVGRGLRALGSVLERKAPVRAPTSGPDPAPWEETPES